MSAPSIVATERASGRVLTWSGGRFGGDAELAAMAERMCRRREVVALTVTGPFYEADSADPLAAVAVCNVILGGDFDLSGDLDGVGLDEAMGSGDSGADGGEETVF